jgi:Chitobiase/beta-hexosaminidase C-terminal domain
MRANASRTTIPAFLPRRPSCSRAYGTLVPTVAAAYTSMQSVTIISATSGASIRYTTDASTPISGHGLSHYSFNYPAWRMSQARYVNTFALLDWRREDVVRGLLDHTVDFGIVRKSAMVQPLKFHPLGKFGAVTPRYPHRGCAGTGR